MSKRAQKPPEDTQKRAVLTFLSGEHFDENLKLKKEATIFGRDKGDIIISDSEVSATHCQIQEISGIYHIFDMNSTNGTYLNGDKIIKATLKQDDIITVGNTSFKISFDDENKLRDMPTMFKASLGDSSRNSSLIETLIESELQQSQTNGLQIKIKYSSGESDVVKLKQRIVYIGRASHFGKFDNDPEISRKHLLVKLNNKGEIFAEDQGSTNGSYLNGKKMRGMHQILPQDHIKIGKIDLIIVAESM